MANGYKICIPARLKSSRLEQKLLCNVNGKTIIQRTWERCLQSSADTVTVITDSTEISTVYKKEQLTTLLLI